MIAHDETARWYSQSKVRVRYHARAVKPGASSCTRTCNYSSYVDTYLFSCAHRTHVDTIIQITKEEHVVHLVQKLRAVWRGSKAQSATDF